GDHGVEDRAESSPPIAPAASGARARDAPAPASPTAATMERTAATVLAAPPRPSARAAWRQPQRNSPSASIRAPVISRARDSAPAWRANTHTSQRAAPYMGKASTPFSRSIHGP